MSYLETVKGKKNMKKTLVLLCYTSALCLAACSLPSASAPSSLPSASSPAAESVSPSGSTSPDNAKSVFDFTKDELISSLQHYLEDLQDTEASAVSVLPSDISPTVKEAGETDTALAGSYYTYQIHDGVTLTIVDSAQSGKIQRVSLSTSTSVLFSEIYEDPAKDFAMYMGTLLFIFEPDQDELSRLESELHLTSANLSEDHLYSATGSISNYQYSLSGGDIMFLITPV